MGSAAEELVEAELARSYWELYPRREGVALRSVELLPSGAGVVLELTSDVEGVSHFTYYVNGEGPYRSDDGRVEVRFREGGARQVVVVEVRAVTGSGEVLQPRRIRISYCPSELYEARGLTYPSWVIVGVSDVAMLAGRVEDWVTDEPSEADVEFIRSKWGRLVEGAESDYEAACAVAKSLIDELEPHRGIPSDAMRGLSPLEQYRRATSGLDRVWCENIASMFSYACNALGLPCRKVSLGRLLREPGEGPGLLLAECHLTVEVFCEDLNQWVWMDPTMYVLGTYIGEVGPLNLMEFYFLLNAPGRLSHLRVREYDPKSGADRVVPLAESRARDGVLNYLKRDQGFRYHKRVVEGG